MRAVLAIKYWVTVMERTYWIVLRIQFDLYWLYLRIVHFNLCLLNRRRCHVITYRHIVWKFCNARLFPLRAYYWLLVEMRWDHCLIDHHRLRSMNGWRFSIFEWNFIFRLCFILRFLMLMMLIFLMSSWRRRQFFRVLEVIVVLSDRVSLITKSRS